MIHSLQTGIELLDRKLHGGVPVGSLTAVMASPASQSELLLYELSSVRPTLYLTTVRAAVDVRAVMSCLSFDDADIVVAEIDGDALVEHTLELAQELPPESTLVIDPMEAYEHLSPAEYGAFLNDLRGELDTADSVGFLHCLDGSHLPPRRDLTAYVADLVFRLSTERRGDSVENFLTIPKFRGGLALEDVIKLTLTTDIDVDVSRNIV